MKEKELLFLTVRLQLISIETMRKIQNIQEANIIAIIEAGKNYLFILILICQCQERYKLRKCHKLEETRGHEN